MSNDEKMEILQAFIGKIGTFLFRVNLHVRQKLTRIFIKTRSRKPPTPISTSMIARSLLWFGFNTTYLFVFPSPNAYVFHKHFQHI